MPSISLTNPENITNLTLGTSSEAKLGGNIDLSKFNSLVTLDARDIALNSIVGFENLLALTNVNIQLNKLIGSIPNLSVNTLLLNFNCQANQLTGSIPDLSSNTLIRHFNFHNNQLTGSIPALSSNAELKIFSCHTNQLSGSIPDLSSNTQLTTFNCFNNELTGFDGGTVSNTLNAFRANNNQLTESAINAILAAFVAAGASGGTLVLNDTGNAAPTGQGITDKNTLISRSWSVTTN
tara:strand:+ start:82 stop:792 length:711 start_codon:yes stop_codon:yes gene_type:complete